MTYRTCKHLSDTGRACASAAVTHYDYCAYHLHHRARLMRMTQYRARRQRLLLQLPPLEDMYAVQSALNQLSEAASAGMIDLKQARFLLSVVRAAGQFLLRADKWPAGSVFHSDQPAPEIDLAKQYGLPPDLNLDVAPEAAFPQSQDVGAPPLSAASADDRVGFDTSHQPLATDHSLPDLPFSGNYCGAHHSRECECCRIRPDYPVTPEMVEVYEVSETQGPDVAAARSKQLMRNTERRRLNRDRKYYAAVALEHNIRRAADKMSERKLAERARQNELADQGGGEVPKKPAASANSPLHLDEAASKFSA